MVNEFKSHKISYSILIVVLFLSILMFLHFWPNRFFQSVVAVIMGVFYFVWGVIVHKKNDHINARVIFEYLAVATLGVSLLLLLLN